MKEFCIKKIYIIKEGDKKKRNMFQLESAKILTVV